jgi:hypothetical protein
VSETCLRVGYPILNCYCLWSGGDRPTKDPGRR